MLIDCFADVDDIPMAPHWKRLSEDDKKRFIIEIMIKLHKNPKLDFASTQNAASIKSDQATLSVTPYLELTLNDGTFTRHFGHTLFCNVGL